MKNIFFLAAVLFFCINSFAQITENWITPFATIEFEDDLIVYKYGSLSPICGLEPEFVYTDKIKPIFDVSIIISCKEVIKGKKILHQYLLNPEYPKNDKSDIIRYIKAFALQTILAMGEGVIPSKELFSKIEQLAVNPDNEIEKRAEQVINLYHMVFKSLVKQNGKLDYLYELETATIIPEMFTGDRIISSINIYEDKIPSDSTTWPKYYGEPNRNDYSRDIMETYDKGVLICGGYDNVAWLIKTDINGNMLWEKILECDGFNYLNAIHQTMDGGTLVCGAIQYNTSGTMPYIVKLNSCGQKEWCKSFYTPEELPWAQDIKETPNGDIIILVNQYGDYPEETMHLFKLNAFGDVLWKKPYCSGYVHPEAAIPLGRSLNILSQNDYIINGYVYWEDPWNPGGTKGLRPLFVKIDSNGNEKWVLPFGLNDTLIGQANNSFEISDDIFYGVGRYADVEAGINRKGLIMKFDIYGNELDYNIFDFNQINSDFDVGLFWDIQPIDSVYILASYYGNQQWSNTAPPGEIIFDTSDFFTNSTFLNYNHYLGNREPYNVRLTNASKFLSNSVFDQPSNWDIALSKLNLDMEYDTAYPGNYTYDSLCTTPGQPQSGFIYLDDCDIITGIDIPSPGEYYAHLLTIPLTVYPNPSNERVTFAMENTVHHNKINLKCFNLLGKQVYETMIIKGQKETSVVVSNWPQGMYVAVVYSDGLPVGQCKFVVQ